MDQNTPNADKPCCPLPAALIVSFADSQQVYRWNGHDWTLEGRPSDPPVTPPSPS